MNGILPRPPAACMWPRLCIVHQQPKLYDVAGDLHSSAAPSQQQQQLSPRHSMNYLANAQSATACPFSNVSVHNNNPSPESRRRMQSQPPSATNANVEAWKEENPFIYESMVQRYGKEEADEVIKESIDEVMQEEEQEQGQGSHATNTLGL